jgi:hypothetical protein
MRILFYLTFLLSFTLLNAQTGGESVYNFLNVPVSARAQYLGRAGMSYCDEDISLIVLNPSHLSTKMHQKMLVSANILFNNSFNALGYAHEFKKVGTIGFVLQGNSYGEIPVTDVNGVKTGTMRPSNFVLNNIYEYSVGSYRLGFNGKIIYSNLGQEYNSFACGLDIAITRTDSSNFRSFSFIIKNLGGQIIPYEFSRERLPFDIQFGFSQRLKHLPFRFGILLHNLYRWDITYDDPALFKVNSFSNNATPVGKYGFVDNLLRHVCFSGEFYFGKSFRVGIGYDHQRRAELAYESGIGLSGFSIGFNIVTKAVDIGYSLAKYSVVGSSNQFSAVIKINELYKKH